MKANELRGLSSEELLNRVKELRKNLFNLSSKRKYGKVGNPRQFRENKREIARIMTVLKENKGRNK